MGLEGPVVRLEGPALRVACQPARGLLISELVDRRSGENLLWLRAKDPGGVASRDLGPAGPASVSSWADRLFVGGWFAMFPAAGHPGELDGQPTHLHGELPRLPWTVVRRSAAALVATVDLVGHPVRVERTVAVTDSGATVASTFSNLGSAPIPYTHGEHPCLSRAAFAGGRIELTATRAWTSAPAADPAAAAVVPGASFDWPDAPASAGGRLDLSALPADPDSRHDHVSLDLAAPQVRITAPRLGLALELRFALADYPHLLLWENFAAPGAPADDTCDVFGVEPMSAPGRSVDDAVAADAVRRLDPGETRTTTLELVISDL